METITVKVLDPKGKKVLQELEEKKLISNYRR